VRFHRFTWTPARGSHCGRCLRRATHSQRWIGARPGVHAVDVDGDDVWAHDELCPGAT
jgi:hypothetical protein